MYIWYENYKGGVNNLCVVQSDGITTTSTKGKDTAVENHLRKLREESTND
jgi:hypothetical protein